MYKLLELLEGRINMGKRKKVDYSKIIKHKNKKLPILTLDARWHELFPDGLKTSRIKELEKKVNQLLKKQGKMVNDIKDMKKVKKNLMSDIVANMDIKDDLQGKRKERKLERNKKFILEINQRIDKASDMLSELPYKIREANEELILETIKCVYERIISNQEKMLEISEWIDTTREELKYKILSRYDMKTSNISMYTYIHDIIDTETINFLDTFYNINKNIKE